MVVSPIRRWVSKVLDGLTAQIVVFLLLVAWLVVTVVTYSKSNHNSDQTRKLAISNQQVIKNTNEFTQCVANWANITTQRNERLSANTSARSDALSVLEEVRHQVFAVVAKMPFDLTAFNKALDDDNMAWKDYVAKNDALNKAIEDNPIPTAPKFVCGDKP